MKRALSIAALAAALLAPLARGEPEAAPGSGGAADPAAVGANAERSGAAPPGPAGWSASARAQPGESAAAQPARERLREARGALATTGWNAVLRLGAVTGVLVAALAGLAAFARRRTRRRLGEAGNIDVLAMRGLGPRHRLALIEVGGHRLLVGMGHESIRTLLDLSEADSFAPRLADEIEELPVTPLEPAKTPLEPGAHSDGFSLGRFEGLDG